MFINSIDHIFFKFIISFVYIFNFSNFIQIRERCVGGPKSTDFYPTIKPFLTNKGSNITKDIILEDNNKNINHQLQVANNFNNFFINVAKYIGNDNDSSAEEHPSIIVVQLGLLLIVLEKWNYLLIPKLIFPEIENDFASKQINKAN
jgi:hypothetical protein